MTDGATHPSTHIDESRVPACSNFTGGHLNALPTAMSAPYIREHELSPWSYRLPAMRVDTKGSGGSLPDWAGLVT